MAMVATPKQTVGTRAALLERAEPLRAMRGGRRSDGAPWDGLDPNYVEAVLKTAFNDARGVVLRRPELRGAWNAALHGDKQASWALADACEEEGLAELAGNL